MTSSTNCFSAQANDMAVVATSSPTSPAAETTEGERSDLPSACQIERASSASSSPVPYIGVNVLGIEVSALLDTSGSVSLIVGGISKLCQMLSNAIRT